MVYVYQLPNNNNNNNINEKVEVAMVVAVKGLFVLDHTKTLVIIYHQVVNIVIKIRDHLTMVILINPEA
jgi:hypothetical protein